MSAELQYGKNIYKNTKKVNAMKVKHFKTWIDKSLGLMLENEPNIGVFHETKVKKWRLHSWFCKYPLHLFFLDKKGGLVEYGYLKPWSTYISRNKAMYLIEMPISKSEVEMKGRFYSWPGWLQDLFILGVAGLGVLLMYLTRKVIT